MIHDDTANSRQQWQWILMVSVAILAGALTLFVCCRTHHSLIRARLSGLQHNVPPLLSIHHWLHESLYTPLSHHRLSIPRKTSLRSCSWPWFVFKDMIWPPFYMIRKSNAWKLLAGFLVVALVARELLAYKRHLQHADPDASECSCRHHKPHSLSRTAYCTFSAHRQDLQHLLQILIEEAATLREEVTDRIRLSKELAKVMNLLETWSVRYSKMLRAKAFIKGFRKGEARGHRLARKEGRAAGYVAGEQKNRLKGYARGWKDGYEKGRKKGFRRGKREGYAQGYKDGCGEGKPKGKAEAC
ncbi:hypothetical protein E2C01_019984 [Portunus trituberculatus]|uniref:Essential protein Yae1 N-terminal domain-containing protein n=1 Tax=Portunus trituberculatus TaxID=210409 RepID=A0A5B7E0V8_PORTR|nr:hypothetical protein [Portunus trituberculatus]